MIVPHIPHLSSVPYLSRVYVPAQVAAAGGGAPIFQGGIFASRIISGVSAGSTTPSSTTTGGIVQ